jgi:4a-hydroxytetrahydrobiopterin dehydratase
MTWQEKDNFLQKNFKFKTFAQAIDFINQVAEIAENLDHHPEIQLHDYNQVLIKTTTHDQGKITKKDFELTKKIDLLK